MLQTISLSSLLVMNAEAQFLAKYKAQPVAPASVRLPDTGKLERGIQRELIQISDNCYSISAVAENVWCQRNCNHVPRHCPVSLCKCDGGAPTPTPPTPTPPTPAPPTPTPPTPTPPTPTPPINNGDIISYYSWNWGSGSFGPYGATSGISFTGLSDVVKAIDAYNTGDQWWTGLPELKGTRYISIGGGNSAGFLGVKELNLIKTQAQTMKDAGYQGIIFDVEHVKDPHAEMIPAFNQAFKQLKQDGMIVAVTTSHSAPYEAPTPEDSVELLKAWVKNPDIDFISPQLYSTGQEADPEFAETNFCKDAGCTWDHYVGALPRFVPSINNHTHYAAVVDWFAARGITCEGYVQWQQVSKADSQNPTPPTPAPPAPTPAPPTQNPGDGNCNASKIPADCGIHSGNCTQCSGGHSTWPCNFYHNGSKCEANKSAVSGWVNACACITGQVPSSPR